MEKEYDTRSSAGRYEPETMVGSGQVPVPIGLPENKTLYPPEDYTTGDKDIERDLDETLSQDSGLIQGPPLSQAKKYCLLALFCLGVFMDGKHTDERVSFRLTR